MRCRKVITYRNCPRCNWKLNVAKDQHGWFLECINCGFTRDVKPVHAKNKVRATVNTAK